MAGFGAFDLEVGVGHVCGMDGWYVCMYGFDGSVVLCCGVESMLYGGDARLSCRIVCELLDYVVQTLEMRLWSFQRGAAWV